VDTPGHADFGSEVERVLRSIDTVLLVVDAQEGPMPQTRFVLKKSLELGLKPIVVINKVDKPNCRPDEVHDAVFELFFNLDASEDQLNFKTVYGSSKQGWMGSDYKTPTEDFEFLLDTILSEIPAPPQPQGTPQLMVTSLDFSTYIGRISIGRLTRGELRENMPVTLVKRDGKFVKSRIRELYTFEGLGKAKVAHAVAGDIIAVTGIEGFEIGDTIADFENPEGLTPIAVDEPTMSMLFTINNSPFYGKDGKFVTSRHLKERLEKELEKNLALRVEPTNSADSFLVYGRGILHLSVLIETMRREGYELQIGQPRVLVKDIDGVKNEPIEELTIDLPTEMTGTAIEAVTKRKGEMKNLEPKGDRTVLTFEIPSRGIIGLRSYMLTATQGEAIMTHRFKEYQPMKGEIPGRLSGSLICLETGNAIAYSISNLQDRGRFFVEAMEEVYEGQVIGEHTRDNDLVVNVTKTKQLTNMRASGTDAKNVMAPPIKFSLEEALEYIGADEYVEVTPKSLRIRKIYLNENDRKRFAKQFQTEY
jgi:GTP-binding protein